MPAAEPVAQEQQEAPWWHRIGQMLMYYYLFTTVKNMVMPASPVPEASITVNATSHNAPPVKALDVADPLNNVTSFKAGNLWRNHQPFFLDVFVSPNKTADLSTLAADIDPLSGKIWEKDFTYDWENQSPDMFGQEPLPNEETIDLATMNPNWLPMLANNQSLYAHAIMRIKGAPLLPTERGYMSWGVIHASAPLNTYQAAPKKKKSLLSKDFTSESTNESQIDDTNDSDAKVLFLIPDITVRMLHDFTVFTTGAGSMSSIPPELRGFYHIDLKAKGYPPVAYIDRFWTLPDAWIPVNSTTLATVRAADADTNGASIANAADMVLPVKLGFQPTSLVRWRIQQGMQQSWESQKGMGMSSDKETADFKRMILETQPWLLAITVVISTLHMLFDFLAFKNDIAFWKNNKDATGLSFRTIILNLISQAIIFFYLLDNETSWMILLSNGMSVLIEGWKITKAADVTMLPEFPYISIKEHDSESETAEHDRVAFKYLSLTLIPLVVGYSIYTLLYEEHTSWYSWILATLVGTVYTFGFIGMCPQLYLNYKLQSVAHLPWKMLTYKALNTFIDDIFAFVIKMPTLHRIACLRDDLIFVVFLYQKWHYRTDYARTNEFGVSFAPADEESKVDDLKNDDNNDKITEAKATPAPSAEASKPEDEEEWSDDVVGDDAAAEDKQGALRRRPIDSLEDVD